MALVWGEALLLFVCVFGQPHFKPTDGKRTQRTESSAAQKSFSTQHLPLKDRHLKRVFKSFVKSSYKWVLWFSTDQSLQCIADGDFGDFTPHEAALCFSSVSAWGHLGPLFGYLRGRWGMTFSRTDGAAFPPKFLLPFCLLVPPKNQPNPNLIFPLYSQENSLEWICAYENEHLCVCVHRRRPRHLIRHSCVILASFVSI